MTEWAVRRVLVVLFLFSLTGLIVLVLRTDLMPPAVRQMLGVMRNQPDDSGPHRVYGPKSPSLASTRKPVRELKEELSNIDVPQEKLPVREMFKIRQSFPSRTGVILGVSRAEFIAKYGEPDAVATWSDKGVLHEKLVYRGSGKYVEIVIDAGKVASVQSNDSADRRARP